MNREDFRKLITSRMIFMDGATGSILLKRGMPTGVCQEKWIVENPEVISTLQREYRNAGSDIILSPGFGANRPLLTEHGLGDETVSLNKALVNVSKKANPDALIAGDVSMTGVSLEPMGDTTFEELIGIYKEQISAIAEAGADLIVIETVINLADARAAVIAAREVCDLPIMVTMSFNENGMTLYGTSPESAVITLQGLGIDAFGVNCSAGPDNMYPIIEKIVRFAKVPIIVKPNAGMPKVGEDGSARYDMKPEEFVSHFKRILDLGGVNIVGGCCGTSPDFIKALKDNFSDFKVKSDIYQKTFEDKMVATSRLGVFLKDAEDFEEVEVDVFSPDEIIDEINEMQSDFLCIKGSDPAKIEAALRVYNGIALYKGDPKEGVIEVLNKYGAVL
ncbi:MAG: homocysteine S-methyltransferase family protein [Lachnospiraceae bacterium]|nr:homocysteine S-methyltransferase family protein [Lachnospiraceae bacterium]